MGRIRIEAKPHEPGRKTTSRDVRVVLVRDDGSEVDLTKEVEIFDLSVNRRSLREPVGLVFRAAVSDFELDLDEEQARRRCTMQEVMGRPTENFHGWERVVLTTDEHLQLFADPVYQRTCSSIPEELKEHLGLKGLAGDGTQFVGSIGFGDRRRALFVRVA